MILPLESVDEILSCRHSNEISLVVLFQGTITFSIFYKMKFWIFIEFRFLAPLGFKGLTEWYNVCFS